MKNSRSKQIKPLIAAVCITALLAVTAVFLIPLVNVSAETLPNKYFGEVNAEVCANNSADEIATLKFRVEMECDDVYGSPNNMLYTFKVQCIVTPKTDRKKDIFRVDGFDILPDVIIDNGLSEIGYAAIPKGSNSVSYSIPYQTLPILQTTDKRMVLSDSVYYTAGKNGDHYYCGTGEKDKPVSIGFICAYSTSAELTNTIIFRFKSLEITGIAFAPNYEISNDEEAQITFSFNKSNNVFNCVAGLNQGSNDSDYLTDAGCSYGQI